MSDIDDAEDLFGDAVEFGDAGDEPDLDEAEAALRDAESHDWSENQLGGSAELDEGIEDAEAALDEIEAESSLAGSDELFAEFDGFDDFGGGGDDLGAVLDVLRANPGLKITLSF